MKKFIVVYANEQDSLDVSVSVIEADNQEEAEEFARSYEDIERELEHYETLIVKEIPEGPLAGGSAHLASFTNG